MLKLIAQAVLRGLLTKIAAMDEKKIAELVKKINGKIDVPGLDETQEASAIRTLLCSCVKVAKTLLENV
jgi:hypothetical protein